jgi:hypothetical protein
MKPEDKLALLQGLDSDSDEERNEEPTAEPEHESKTTETIVADLKGLKVQDKETQEAKNADGDTQMHVGPLPVSLHLTDSDGKATQTKILKGPREHVPDSKCRHHKDGMCVHCTFCNYGLHHLQDSYLVPQYKSPSLDDSDDETENNANGVYCDQVCWFWFVWNNLETKKT